MQINMDTLKQAKAIYLAKPEYHKELATELGQDIVSIENLFFSPHPLDVCFAKDRWLNPQFIEFQSISEAAAVLKMQENGGILSFNACSAWPVNRRKIA